MPKFLLEKYINSDGSEEINGWWMIVGNFLYNEYGGYHSYIPSDNDIIAEADNFKKLDYRKVYHANYDCGFISPSGTFYGCMPSEHSTCAERLFNCTEDELINKGFLKVFKLNKRGYKRETIYTDYVWITESQRAVISDRNIKKIEDICF